MKYIVDAYNVIGQLDHIKLSDSDKVAQFIDWLHRHKQPKMTVTIVFDGQDPWLRFPTQERQAGLTIVHTATQQSADDFIKEKMDQLTDKSSTIIVTSDRDILHHAKKLGVKTINAKHFILMMLKDQVVDSGKPSMTMTDQQLCYWLNEFGDSFKE